MRPRQDLVLPISENSMLESPIKLSCMFLGWWSNLDNQRKLTEAHVSPHPHSEKGNVDIWYICTQCVLFCVRDGFLLHQSSTKRFFKHVYICFFSSMKEVYVFTSVISQSQDLMQTLPDFTYFCHATPAISAFVLRWQKWHRSWTSSPLRQLCRSWASVAALQSSYHSRYRQ